MTLFYYTLFFIAVFNFGFFTSYFFFYYRYKRNPVATLYVTNVPNDGFYSVGVKIHVPYYVLSKGKYELVKIDMVEKLPEKEEVSDD